MRDIDDLNRDFVALEAMCESSLSSLAEAEECVTSLERRLLITRVIAILGWLVAVSVLAIRFHG